jgi:hypothetical protein
MLIRAYEKQDDEHQDLKVIEDDHQKAVESGGAVVPNGVTGHWKFKKLWNLTRKQRKEQSKKATSLICNKTQSPAVCCQQILNAFKRGLCHQLKQF